MIDESGMCEHYRWRELCFEEHAEAPAAEPDTSMPETIRVRDANGVFRSAKRMIDDESTYYQLPSEPRAKLTPQQQYEPMIRKQGKFE
jgi:hypothetical protein